MKKIKIVLILSLLFSFSCVSNEYWKLKIEIPRKTSFNLDQYNEVVITNFLIRKENKDFNLNQELVDYFSFEIGKNFKGKVSKKEITFEEEPFTNETFWKNLLPDRKEAILFTGGVQYTEEIRKAILKQQKRRFEDPFDSEKRSLVERRFYTLNLDLYIIDAKTGKTLYKRNFKESKTFENPRQTAPFAFFELLQNTKTKFFRNILGAASIQERYIIYN